jgi:hypothetical protein
LGGWLGQAHSQGVGNTKALQIYKKNLQNIQNVLGKMLEIRYPKRYQLAEACGRIRAESPLVAGKFLQKPAS